VVNVVIIFIVSNAFPENGKKDLVLELDQEGNYDGLSLVFAGL